MTSILPIFEVLQGLVNFSCFLHSTSEGNEPLRGPSSRRPRKPIILGAEQYFAVPDLLPEPYRTMVNVAWCLMRLLGLLSDLPLRGLQQSASATQCRPPEFGRRAAISLAECSAEMAMTGKAPLLAQIRQVVIVGEKVQRPCKPQAQLIAV